MGFHGLLGHFIFIFRGARVKYLLDNGHYVRVEETLADQSVYDGARVHLTSSIERRKSIVVKCFIGWKQELNVGGECELSYDPDCLVRLLDCLVNVDHFSVRHPLVLLRVVVLSLLRLLLVAHRRVLTKDYHLVSKV